MMLGLQGSTSSPKVYRCVACSATFTGLASLLVHQATHANELSKVPAPPQPNISPHETLCASVDSSSRRPSPLTLMPECPSSSLYICDCGEEFQDFSLMLEHKQSHVSQTQLTQPLDRKSVFSSDTQHVSFIPTATQPGLVLSSPSTSRFPAVELPTVTDHKADVSLGDSIAIVTTPQGQCTPPQDDSEKQLENIATAEKIPEIVEDMHLQDKTNSVLSSEKGESLPKNNSLMKLLASAYMKHFPHPLSPTQNKIVIPKQEDVPVDITPVVKSEVSSINDLSTAQLRRLLAKPGIKTNAPSISKILESSKKKVVCLTKTFSPVVVLETRQKLMDAGSNGTYGRFQCGRCRRVFQNVVKLTEHHFLHKKERIKCCRRCKQLIIGRLPLPDNHVCPHLGNKTIQPSSSFKKKLPFAQKIVPFPSLSHSRKVFFCPLCKHSYARRWNLKMHKCQGPGSAPSLLANPSSQKRLVLRSNNEVKTDAEVQSAFQNCKNIAVGTDVTGRIKVEVTSPNSKQSAVSQLAWTHPANSFSPFYPKSTKREPNTDPSVCGVENSWDAAAVDNEDSNEGQWTMPLDDETEVLTSTGKAGNDSEMKRSVSAVAEMAPPSLRYFVRDGVKRYPCKWCQKTYSRPSTLRRHLRLCGFRPRGPGSVAQGGSQASTPLTANNMKPMFACFVCGKTFNRKDNMMVHRKKCQLQQTMTDGRQMNRANMQQSVTGNAADCQTKEDDGGNWGIMSLPSVLPRRVTCECGVGFTSPRLLLEHLQKHAQESYTCPTCGETVSSWADYEVHLQIHMHPHHQLLKGLQPQRSQPLLLRFQQQPPQQQQPPSPTPLVSQPPPKQPRKEQLLNPTKKQQRLVCTRCGNTFSSRCSLRRHISWNRCKGGRATNPTNPPKTNPPKTYRCSHCNSDFPNTVSLMFHQRSGACKPAIKPVRCPVCLRWFGTMDGLQKHLLTHKQCESHRCDVCHGTYPNLKSLKNHRRRIHRIMAGDIKPKTQCNS
ncbi:zinc finger protein 865 [Etheostoma spectabile]|uniref:zinc finger protein 865 n=1 Tax=Etheostoma spectabile TaxID=54343 RepID=UPI0013AED906|nr:zinc finger protein 865-like [Etheostoma spectabile]